VVLSSRGARSSHPAATPGRSRPSGRGPWG
jgi:hypothetical protein